jgi:hypothetical protein
MDSDIRLTWRTAADDSGSVDTQRCKFTIIGAPSRFGCDISRAAIRE